MENEVVRPTIVSYSARGSQWNQASPVVSLASALNWQYFRWSSRLGLVVVCDVAVLLLRISACADAGSGLGVWPDWRAQPRPLANYVDGHCVCAVLSWVGGFVLSRKTVLGLGLDVDWFVRTDGGDQNEADVGALGKLVKMAKVQFGPVSTVQFPKRFRASKDIRWPSWRRVLR